MSQSFNKHHQRFQLPLMNVNQRPKRANKFISQTADIYLQQSQQTSKNRNANVPLRSKNNYETIKSSNRKSIEINTSKNATLQPPQRTYYRRGAPSFQKQPPSKRYEDEELRGYSKSPYIKRELQGRTTSLNRSTHKIKSSNVMARTPNPQPDLYKPHSSLSQHYDPQETSLHKRRVSVANQDRNYILEEAKEYYRRNEFLKSVELLKKYVKFNKDCSEARYFLGMSYINNNEFSLGIQELLETLAIDPKYKKSLYLVIALAYKKLNKIDDSIEILTKGLTHFPDYYDCLVYRGKMYLKGSNYQASIKDFNKAIHLNPKKGFAYLGKATAQKELGMVPQAIQTLTQGLKSDMEQGCLQKRGMCYFDQKNYEKAITDFQKCKQGSTATGGSLHYIKGITYYKLKKPMEAILSFQQSLKQDTNQQNVTSSVEMMMKIKIEDKDFYEAYHILTRTSNIDINKDIIDQWRLFLEGALFLMKKKYKEGINTLKSLLSLPLYSGNYDQIVIKKNKQRYEFLKPLVHLYKAFGELSQGNVEVAKEDYRQYDIICKKMGSVNTNLSKNYNSLIVQAEDRFPNNCLKLIEQAIALIPNKPQPYLFLAFEKVQNSLQKQPEHKQQTIQFIIQTISTAIGHLPQLSNNHVSIFYYYRAVMQLYKGDFNKAVADVDKAIEKSEDNIPKYFYLRGLSFAIFGNFSQSIQDLSVAISLDDKYAKPYLERAKCLQIEGNSNQAFLDLQKYITLAPEDPFIHKYAGFLLFQNCAYEDCLAAFSHGQEELVDQEMLLTRAKCQFLLNNSKECLELFSKYEELTFSAEFRTDIELIKICSTQIKENTSLETHKQNLRKIQKLIEGTKNEQTDCKIFKMRDMHQIRASIYLLMQDYEQSLIEFDKTLLYFRHEKKRQLQKQFIQDTQQFQDEWSQVQIKFNIALAHIGMKNYTKALEIINEFQKSTQRGKNWDQFSDLVENLKLGNVSVTQHIEVDTFQQNHRISKNWPRFKVPGYEIYLSLAFSYPFVQPPEMLPEFDESLFLQFHMSKIEKKPEAPWINRHSQGLVFTPQIQVFENLQLSITTKKPNQDQNQSQINKPISELDRSVELSSSEFQMETEALKQRFKLDSLVEMKLRKLMEKKDE